MNNTTGPAIPLNIEHAINTIADDLNDGKVVIFCGAGISRDSGFPIVSELLLYLLLVLCTDSKDLSSIKAILNSIPNCWHRQDKLKQLVAGKMETSPESIDNIINSLPFESFMETLASISSIDKILDIYNEMFYRPIVEPNFNHIMLAKLIANGKVKTVVTTNFDRLIEKALEQQGKRVGLDYDVIYKEEDFGKIDWQQDRSRLIKIHGSIDNKQEMAITLRRIAGLELSASRARIISHVFSEGDHRMVLILGYSCSDVFDLSPQIESLAKNLKQVFLIQHSAIPGIQNIRDQKQKNPFNSFDKSFRLFIDTNDLMKALWKVTLDEPFIDHQNLETSSGWDAAVRDWYADCVRTNSAYIGDVISGLIFYDICQWQAANNRYERVLSSSMGHINDRLKGFVLSHKGLAHQALGEYDKAIKFYEQALELARSIGDTRGEGNAINNMGLAHAARGEYEQAINLFEQAASIARNISDARGESNAVGNIGNAYSNLGNYRKAIELYEQHLIMARSNGDVRGEGWDLDNMGVAYSYLGRYDKAINFYEQALSIAKKIGDARRECTTLNNMGNAYCNLGEHAKAISFYEQALDIACRIGDVMAEGRNLNNIGIAHYNLGEYDKAIEFSGQAVNKALKVGDVRGESYALNQIGLSHAALGEHSTAVKLYEESLIIARRTHDVNTEGSVLCNMGLAHATMGDAQKASQYFDQSKHIFTKLGLLDMVSSIAKMMKEIGLQ